MDLISRQAAIEAVEEITWYHQNRNNEMVSGANSKEDQPWYKADDIYAALNNVPSAQPEQQWTPCSEKLPKEEKRHYWVCTDTGYQCQCRWTNDVYGLGASDRWEWKIFDIPQYQKVVAWMPLPEPYCGARMEESDDRENQTNS